MGNNTRKRSSPDGSPTAHNDKVDSTAPRLSLCTPPPCRTCRPFLLFFFLSLFPLSALVSLACTSVTLTSPHLSIHLLFSHKHTVPHSSSSRGSADISRVFLQRRFEAARKLTGLRQASQGHLGQPTVSSPLIRSARSGESAQLVRSSLFFPRPPSKFRALASFLSLGGPFCSDALRRGFRLFRLCEVLCGGRGRCGLAPKKPCLLAGPYPFCRCTSRPWDLRAIQAGKAEDGQNVQGNGETSSQNPCRFDREAVAIGDSPREACRKAKGRPTANEQISGGTGLTPQPKTDGKERRLEMMNIRHLAERGEEVVDVLLRRHEPEDLVEAARKLTEELLPKQRQLQLAAWRAFTERRKCAADYEHYSKKTVVVSGQSAGAAELLHKAARSRKEASACLRELRACEKATELIIRRLPNALDERVPSGADATGNRETMRWTPHSSSRANVHRDEVGAAHSTTEDPRVPVEDLNNEQDETPDAPAGIVGRRSSASPDNGFSEDTSQRKDGVGYSEMKGHADLIRAFEGDTHADATTKMAGRRHVALRGPVAQLHRALKNFFLDFILRTNQFQEVGLAPLIVSRSAIEGTGQLPRLESALFPLSRSKKLQVSGEDGFLIPTAEVPLVGLFRQRILAEEDLPIRLVGATPCFRLEDGAYGRGSKGLIRQQVFEKVETVVICTPEQAEREHRRLRKIAAVLLQ
ncbi:serine--trna ligase [Cystoisospora suis]|uniref:Seryl-tRNA(Ser/Sec) synthetase n=1 Tax=Cystoisospora suis TaxID=483139 RepID=A0A2C6KWK7_9APIC|nr:serine--trna ligase [Cystoisospora suis]